jgi:hypothetical protein
MMNYDLIQYIFILYLGYSGLDTSQEEWESLRLIKKQTK